jgi:RecA/RadA recombinase
MGFKPAGDCFGEIREERATAKDDSCSFGVKFLDKAFKGIKKRDLVLIAAPPGAGKTEIAVHIAITNSMAGKRVHFFALEAENNEVTKRLLFKEFSNIYHSRSLAKYAPNTTLYYSEWEEGVFDAPLAEAQLEAEEKLKPKIENLNVYYRGEDFNERELEKNISSVAGVSDLIIVDHIHYIDVDDRNENASLAKVMKRMRSLSLIHGKPIIVVAHVRKPDFRAKKLMPDLDDIHGTSNLGKICTKAFLIGPAKEVPKDKVTFSSYIRIAKHRKEGSRTRYLALVDFDISRNAYNDKYSVGTIGYDEKGYECFTELLPMEIPPWAANKSG